MKHKFRDGLRAGDLVTVPLFQQIGRVTGIRLNQNGEPLIDVNLKDTSYVLCQVSEIEEYKPA